MMVEFKNHNLICLFNMCIYSIREKPSFMLLGRKQHTYIHSGL